jgi:hypothetical protein
VRRPKYFCQQLSFDVVIFREKNEQRNWRDMIVNIAMMLAWETPATENKSSCLNSITRTQFYLKPQSYLCSEEVLIKLNSVLASLRIKPNEFQTS